MTIYDVKTIESISDAMRRYLVGTSSPLTNFNDGSRLKTLLEAIATVIYQTEYDFAASIKQIIPLAVYEGFNFTKLTGVKSNGVITFNRAAAAGADFVIPIGTSVAVEGLTFTTTQLGKILTGHTTCRPDGASTDAPLTAQCTVVGTAGNIAINGIDTLSGKGSFVTQPAGVESAINPSAFTGGRNEESDAERRSRFQQYVNSLARSTVLGLEAGASTVDGVASVKAVENYPEPGIVSLYVDDGSGTLPAPIKTAVEKVINGDPADSTNYPGYRAAGIRVEVVAPNLVRFYSTIEIRVLSSSLADDSEIIRLARNAVTTYVNALRLGYDVILSSIVEAVRSVSSEVYDVLITAPAGNVTVTPDEVPRIIDPTNDLTITVVRIGV